MSAELTGFRHGNYHVIKIHSEDGRLVEITNMTPTPQGVLHVTIKLLDENTPSTSTEDK